MNRGVDLNSDMGESFAAWKMGDDEAMLKIVTSANVACGFHAGDPNVMAKTATEAARQTPRMIQGTERLSRPLAKTLPVLTAPGAVLVEVLISWLRRSLCGG